LPRTFYEKFSISGLFDRKPSDKKISNSPNFVNYGHTVGPGNRAMLHVAIPRNPKQVKPTTSSKQRRTSLGTLRKIHEARLRDNNNYDASIKNEIDLQKKFIS